MSPRNLIVAFIIVVVLFFGWLGLRKLPYLEFLYSDATPENPVNPIVASTWKGPGFLEFLPENTNKYVLSYCTPVRITDSSAGIAAARLPFLNDRSRTGLQESSDGSISFGYCHEDSTVIPWKAVHGLLSGEPGDWTVRFQILSNVGMDQSIKPVVAHARTLEALDTGLDAATHKIGQELTRLAAIKRDQGEVAAESFTDSRDQKTYPVVRFGTTRWFGRDLAYRSKGALCPEGADSICARKGYLYKYEEALDVCPVGWQIPSETQWRELGTYVPRMDLAMIPTREGVPYVDRLSQGFRPDFHGIADGKTGKGRLGTQAWWWSSQTCQEDAYCAPYRKKYIVHLLDDMVVAWGIHWTPRDSAATNGWSRMLAWNQLGLGVRCVQSP